MTPVTVQLSDVTRVYEGGGGTIALQPLTLRIDPGSYVSICGRSGSGKSTLMNILGLLDRPTTGTYELDGADTSTMDDKARSAARRDRIGFVFQQFHLVSGRSAAENVAMGMLLTSTPPRERLPAAHRLLDRLGMAHRRDHLTEHLSGGEQQRVAIARALSGRPGLLLCDEPTGNLDTTTAADVLRELEGLVGELTVLIVTHDLGITQRASRQVELADGRVISVRGRP